MVLLIDIFSINRSRGYENPSFDIIVIELFSIGGFPLEEAREHCSQNQSVISVVIHMSFQCYCGDCSGYIVVILPFLAFYFISGILQVVLEHFPWQKVWVNFFFRVETYSDVFKPQRSIVTCINLWLRDSYTQEIQVVLKHTSVGHTCNPCWYPFEWQCIKKHLCPDQPRFPEALFK